LTRCKPAIYCKSRGRRFQIDSKDLFSDPLAKVSSKHRAADDRTDLPVDSVPSSQQLRDLLDLSMVHPVSLARVGLIWIAPRRLASAF
jgi:hypothetical protein